MAKDKRRSKARRKRHPRGSAARSPGASEPTAASSPAPTDIAELQQARALWARDRLPAALWLFDRAVRRHPNHVLTLVDASRAFGSVYQYRRAESLLQRLVDLGTGRSEILYLAGQSYRLIRRPDEALACFQAALSAGPAPPDIHLELALLYERRHDLDQARDQVENRLRLKPADDEGRMLKGRLQRRQGETAEAETLLRTVAEKRSAHWMTRMRAWAELASLFDAQTRYDDAWQAMLAAKAIGRPHAQSARQHRDRTVVPLWDLARQTTAADFARWRRRAEDDHPQPAALLTGLPRSGTSLLERILNAHSQIVTADEWDAFPRLILPTMLGLLPLQQLNTATLDAVPPERLTRKRHVYFRFLSAALQQPLAGRMLIDKNPSLLPLIPLYRRLIPQGRVIVALRDPRDVLLSCLMTHFPLNDFSVDFLSLETAASRTIADLTAWLALRDKLGSGWTEVKYEDVVNQFPSAIQNVLHALGLDWEDHLPRYRDYARERPIRSPSFDAVERPIYSASIGRWRHYAHQLEPVLPQLESLLSSLGYSA